MGMRDENSSCNLHSSLTAVFEVEVDFGKNSIQ